MKALSPAMRKAIDMARQHVVLEKNVYVGRWCWPGWHLGISQNPGFDSRTIQALVDRGLMEYTEWRQGPYPGAPAEVKLTEPWP